VTVTTFIGFDSSTAMFNYTAMKGSLPVVASLSSVISVPRLRNALRFWRKVCALQRTFFCVRTHDITLLEWGQLIWNFKIFYW